MMSILPASMWELRSAVAYVCPARVRAAAVGRTGTVREPRRGVGDPRPGECHTSALDSVSAYRRVACRLAHHAVLRER
jgi:hypothetical protein